jgi:intracellular septation protein
MEKLDTSSPLEKAASAPVPKPINPFLKLALEAGPLVIFFLANSRAKYLQETFPVLAGLGEPIFVATAVFMLALAISLAASWLLMRTLPIMPLVTFAFVVVLGTLTIWLQNDTFIKIKPTIVNTLFGVILLLGLWSGRNFLRLVLDTAFSMDQEGWDKLAFRWGLYFLLMAVVNEVIWRNFSTDFWVNFKVWGNMPLTILFTMTQIPLIQRHSISDEDPATD